MDMGNTRPFRVLLNGDPSLSAFVYADSLEMARAAACGYPHAKILTLETPH
jgi:hypothetical protein